MGYLFYILPIAIQVALVVHIVKTGRNFLWVWLVIFVPLIGSLAYFIVEILPQWMASRTARRTASNLRRSIDPTRDLRAAHKRLAMNDSVDSRRAVADRLLTRGEYDAAIEHYRAAMTGLYAHEPLLMLGVAKALFAKGEAGAARQMLDELIEHNPDFKSPEGHLLYARALEAAGSHEKALSEYVALAKYYLGAEAMYRYALLLKRMERSAEANKLFKELLDNAELAGNVFRKEQREWIEAARKELQ